MCLTEGEELTPEYVVPELYMYDVEVEKGYGESGNELPSMEEDPWEDL